MSAKKTPIERMREVNKRYGHDPEEGHSRGDDLLCALVREYVPNGAAVVAEYRKLEKWYG